MDVVAESGRNLVSKHRFSMSMENEEVHTGRDSRTRLERPNSQARTGAGKCSFSLFSSPRGGFVTLPG